MSLGKSFFDPEIVSCGFGSLFIFGPGYASRQDESTQAPASSFLFARGAPPSEAPLERLKDLGGAAAGRLVGEPLGGIGMPPTCGAKVK